MPFRCWFAFVASSVLSRGLTTHAAMLHPADVGVCMQAVAWLVDELKAQVPIWKKEQFEGGEVWKENAESRKLLHHTRGTSAVQQTL